MIIFLYVDDFILNGDEKLNRSYKEDLAREFKMRDMGLMQHFLILEVQQGDGEMLISQGRYASDILQRFCTDKYKLMETPLITN